VNKLNAYRSKLYVSLQRLSGKLFLVVMAAVYRSITSRILMFTGLEVSLVWFVFLYSMNIHVVQSDEKRREYTILLFGKEGETKTREKIECALRFLRENCF
jgi:hypothetical protein